MDQEQLNRTLAEACEQPAPNLEEIKKLILSGADPNQVNPYKQSIFQDVFSAALFCAREETTDLSSIVQTIKEVVAVMVAGGWDTQRFGLEIMDSLIFSTHDRHTFDLYQFMLQYDLARSPEQYRDSLEALGTEESYQRCEHNHDQENLFYAIYELVDTKKNGGDIAAIAPYYDAIGLKIDRVLYFGDGKMLQPQQEHTEFYGDIGFVCGDQVVVLCKGIHILLMNNRLKETPQRDVSGVFGAGVLGQTIDKISFAHKTVKKGNTRYGQPTVIVKLGNGKRMKFTHNFGEHPERKYQSRFWIE